LRIGASVYRFTHAMLRSATVWRRLFSTESARPGLQLNG
jgi:hypothetical protein